MEHNTPDHKIILGGHFDGLIVVVGRDKPETILVEPDTFQRELAIDITHRKLVVVRGQTFIDDEQVAVMDTHVFHRVALDPSVKGRRGVFYQLSIEVDGELHKVIRRRRKARTNPRIDEGQGHDGLGRCRKEIHRFGGMQLLNAHSV